MSEDLIPLEKQVEAAREAAMGWNDVLAAFAKRCEELEVDSDTGRVQALNGIKWWKDQKKAIDAKRKSITGPANSIVKSANAEFRPQMDICDAGVKLLTEKVSHYDRERDKEVEKRRKELAKKGVSGSITPAKATVGGVSEKKVWNCKIVDLEKVPMEYCDKVPRIKQLLDACREKDGDVDIPGVEFKRVTSFARR